MLNLQAKDSSFVAPKPKAQAKGRLTDSNVIKRTARELGRSKEQIMVSRCSLGLPDPKKAQV